MPISRFLHHASIASEYPGESDRLSPDTSNAGKGPRPQAGHGKNRRRTRDIPSCAESFLRFTCFCPPCTGGEKRFFLCFLLAVDLLISFTVVKAQTMLRVGVETNYPPFSVLSEDGSPTGFDPCIAEALCRAMQRTCEIMPLPLEELLNSMEEGKLDLVVAGLTANREREAYMDFSDSYYHSRSIYIGRPGFETSREWLKGKKIGVQAGTYHVDIALGLWGDIAEIVPHRSYGGMLDELCAGRLDVIISNGLPGYEFLRSERGEDFVMLETDQPLAEDRDGARMGVRRGDPDLLKAVNDGIRDIKLNGEYEQAARHYFSFGIY